MCTISKILPKTLVLLGDPCIEYKFASSSYSYMFVICICQLVINDIGGL